jgi:hypothetical protein
MYAQSYTDIKSPSPSLDELCLQNAARLGIDLTAVRRE